MKDKKHESEHNCSNAEGASTHGRRKKGSKGRSLGDRLSHRHGGGSRGRHRGRPLGRGQLKYLLLDLASKGPRHGYELMTEIEVRTDGIYKPSPGVIYPAIELMNDLGWISLDVVEGKRLITITAIGREELTANAETLSDLYSRLDAVKQRSIGTETDDLRMLMRKLRHTVKTTIVEKPEVREDIAQLIADTIAKVAKL